MHPKLESRLRSASLRASFAAGCALAGAPAAAQAPIELAIDQAASAYTWSGTTSIGPLQGDPSTNFNLTGTQHVELTHSASQPIATGEFVTGGAALVVPNLMGRIPNPVPVLPPLARITISNLSFVIETPSFQIAPNGSFNALADVTILSGTMHVVPLFGSPTQSDLTGNQSLGQAFSGNLTESAGVITGASSQNTMFMFMDPASGISGSITIVGSLIARHACSAPASYCTATPNSTGAAASTTATGSVRLQDQSLVLGTTLLPPNSLGYYLYSETEAFVPGFGGSQGNLCLGGLILRLSDFVQNAGATGAVSLPLPFAQLPVQASLEIGESWRFQYWFRDLVGGVATSNTSDAVRVVFCP